MTEPDYDSIARGAFAEIQKCFPHLRMEEEINQQVEISITIPVQDGLQYKVWLALQNKDELHFFVEHFWLEWFPCTDPQRVASYVGAVTGFLDGSYRILEHYRGAKCVRAELQAPCNGNWETVGTWSRLCVPIPWGKTYRVIRNAQPIIPPDLAHKTAQGR